MDPSAIFAIAAGAIIIVGRAINRIAEKRGVEVENTTQSFDAQHEFDGEEAIPARPNGDDETLAGTILGQIIAERERRAQREDQQFTMHTKQTQTPQFVSRVSSSTPKRAKTTKRTKTKSNPQPKRDENITTINNIEQNTPELIDDFDLRKAVIYSEILKPKFDE